MKLTFVLVFHLLKPAIDSVVSEKVTKKDSGCLAKSPAIADSSKYGIFAASAKGDNGFITLENNKVELKISLKGGRVYSARLKDYRTYDSLPLILFSGDSTVFGFNFFTADNKAVQTNNLYFKPVSDEKSYVVTSQL